MKWVEEKSGRVLKIFIGSFRVELSPVFVYWSVNEEFNMKSEFSYVRGSLFSICEKCLIVELSIQHTKIKQMDSKRHDSKGFIGARYTSIESSRLSVS